MSYTLYGVEGSYYAAKARAALMCKALPFTEVQADRKAFAEVIVPRVGYPVVPVLITPSGDTLQDTADIVDALEARHPQPALIPVTPRRRVAAFVLELLADEWLKLPALHYRWFYDYEFARHMMGYNNDPHASVAEQQRVGTRIAAGFRDWPQHLGVTAATRAAVEAEFLALLELLETHFRAADYALGATPSLGDCALMGPLYAHLYRDPHSGAIVRERAPALCDWIARMRRQSSPLNVSDDTTDTVPPTLLPVLQRLLLDFVPTVTDAIGCLQSWLAQNPTTPIPRYAGSHPFTLARGQAWQASGTRSVHPFEQWKVQRFIERVSACGRENTIVADFCADLACSALFDINLPVRLERRHFRLERQHQDPPP